MLYNYSYFLCGLLDNNMIISIRLVRLPVNIVVGRLDFTFDNRLKLFDCLTTHLRANYNSLRPFCWCL